MNVDHIHFYVEDASTWRDWFVRKLEFQSIASSISTHTHTEIIQSGSVRFWLSSARASESPVFAYLQNHPAGVADVAFQVADVEAATAQAVAAGAKLLQLPELSESGCKAALIQGWGSLQHTLIERSLSEQQMSRTNPTRLEVDHVVLNVEQGNLEKAIAWYEKALGFQRQQAFTIQTQRSALCSQVLRHPAGNAQLPINQPASDSSQIQEFLDFNRGAGVQHIALQTHGIVETIDRLRRNGMSFLSVPASYYEQLRLRPGFPLSQAEWEAVAAQEVLVDWQPDQPLAVLLQTFTQPIFSEPTFFFELIERRWYWWQQRHQQAQGFGEGNFQALFEAIEREQMKRESLR
ncbi:4-hydroxyphenylpyruvate dioxygenase [Phormidium tenue FACHB-886]|nr:4-hydroxyphenylpyruvate dioxygenase [Phormidium tenue FACHB-886]